MYSKLCLSLKGVCVWQLKVAVIKSNFVNAVKFLTVQAIRLLDMDIAGVYSDLRMEEVGEFIGIRTKAAADILKSVSHKWQAKPHRQSAQLAALKAALTADDKLTFSKLLTEAAEAEPSVQKTLEADPLQEECYGQLLFRGEYFTPLNHIPFLLIVLRFYKIFVTPVMAVSMPLMAIVLPYILIKYVFNMPMSLPTYITLIKKVYSGSLGGPEGTDLISKVKYYAQTGWLIFNFIQSLWAPINSAKHLYKLDQSLVTEGEAINKIISITHSLRDILLARGFKSEQLPLTVSDCRQSVATVLENPDSMRILLKQLGTYEVLYRFAVHPDICIVKWISGKTDSVHFSTTRGKPILRLKHTYDIRLAPESRVTFSVALGTRSRKTKSHFSTKPHAILTGPNRGGKSTALRAIGRSVFLAHTFGCAIGRSAAMTPLRWLQTCLRLEDIPGSKSLFEREVTIAALAKRRLTTGPGLLLIDELFHSTNPPDAEIASRKFLNQLWASPSTLSVISTHLFCLAEENHSHVQQLCCPATDDGCTIKYKYGLASGICRVSSVREILKEQRL